jgi:hypothetical protein
MIKKWISIVFKHNHENIVKGFVKILSQSRRRCLKYMLQCSEEVNGDYDSEK